MTTFETIASPHPPKFEALDGLRGIAALMVFFGHSLTILGFGGWPFGVAVDPFFMISGFVIPYAYEAKIKAGMNFAKFMSLRVIRIYPLYIVGVAIGLIPDVFWTIRDAQIWHLREPLGRLLWAIFVLPQPHWEAQHSFLLNPPAWSLFLELVANAAYCLALPWLSNRVLSVVGIVATAAYAVSVAHFGTIDFGTGGIEMIWGLSRVTCPFTIGALLYRSWLCGMLPRWKTSPEVPGLVFLSTTIALMFLPVALGEFLAVVIICPIVVVVAISSPASGKTATALTWAGALSYPLYAIHLPLLKSPRSLLGTSGVDLWKLTVISLPLILAVAAALIVPDVRVRSWLNRAATALS